MVSHLVLFGVSILNLQAPSMLILLLILRLKSGNKPWSFFFFLTGSEPLNSSFFLLLNLPLWSVLEFLASGEEFAPWIADFIAQWWRFDWISESSRENSIDFGSSLLLKRLGFWNILELFLDLWIWSVTEMREKVWSVCDDVSRDEWICWHFAQ